MAAARLLFPAGSGFGPERIGWGISLGLASIAAELPLALALGIRPGWAVWISLLAVGLAVSVRFRVRPGELDTPGSTGRPDPGSIFWLGLLVLGVGLYLLRALTEPMWSNDYLAIWGLKGKTIFAEGRGAAQLLGSSDLAFSHPEYPLGLPSLYAGLASLLGRWDDHATALVFPAIQVATLAVLFGWLRRRGVSRGASLAAVGLVGLFEPLYSGFLTGMADVPLACAALLVATAWSDALDGTDSGVLRRLATASCLAAAIKNEGVFLACVLAAAVLFPVRRLGPRRLAIAAASAGPAVLVVALQRLVMGSAPLKDFDFGLLWDSPVRVASRIGESLRVAGVEVALPALAGLLCLAVLLVAGRRRPTADRLLAIAAVCLAAYVLLPALAVRGPAWLVRTSLPRTGAALVPLIAAGVAGRLGPRGREDSFQERD